MEKQIKIVRLQSGEDIIANFSENKKTKEMKPLYKPKKNLNQLQKRLMNEHKKHHSEKHLKMMKKLMLKGYCFQQAQTITMKEIGK